MEYLAHIEGIEAVKALHFGRIEEHKIIEKKKIVDIIEP